MADKTASEATEFYPLAQRLESALQTVKTRKANLDVAKAEATTKQSEYDNAVKAAQAIHKEYSEHISQVMTGFAQVHQ